MKGAVSLDVHWQYLKEGGKLVVLLLFGSIVILPDGKSLSKHPPIPHGISLVTLEHPRAREVLSEKAGGSSLGYNKDCS